MNNLPEYSLEIIQNTCIHNSVLNCIHSLEVPKINENKVDLDIWRWESVEDIGAPLCSVRGKSENSLERAVRKS